MAISDNLPGHRRTPQPPSSPALTSQEATGHCPLPPSLSLPSTTPLPTPLDAPLSPPLPLFPPDPPCTITPFSSPSFSLHVTNAMRLPFSLSLSHRRLCSLCLQLLVAAPIMSPTAGHHRRLVFSSPPADGNWSSATACIVTYCPATVGLSRTSSGQPS